ncbi:MAG: hypothetical protein CVV47_03095 [Spirochaetae bacterium HGW-Spirochaetae-3]|jgi:uncharacterized protein (DUF362 family)|nr:MAG: hypothetical protein CVV47_03095 [Spirochaetae bacterium HGW-Spirochaetae-3]
MATVTVERLPALSNETFRKDADGLVDTGYSQDCAALPRDYGTEAWDARPDVAAIRTAVFAALDRLEAETGISSRFSGRPALVKPNLVTVYHEMGMKRRSYPETTDPRVLDATVLWLQRFAPSIRIVESSGRGAPTRGSFKVSGIDRLAARRGCDLVALEETPVDRYILPKATVQREILVPRPFSAVVRGEAAYVSVPKLKTNLYTGVTLGFKNAMGVIPYNLRQRSHHYAIDRKLVEMLYLFRPDLVVIDGVVGAEGECPAPVDPVDSRMIIAGDHPVETDRVATRLMGFDPAAIELMRVADELGFGDPAGARIFAAGFAPNGSGGGSPELGGAIPTPFRPADWKLSSGRVSRAFPGILVLIGINRGGLVATGGKELVDEMQASCRGGCVATTRFAFSMMEAEGAEPRRPVALVIGAGVERDGRLSWYDPDGKAYDEDAIRRLPMKKAVIGSCTRALAPLADRFVDGCMVMPNGPHMVLHELSGVPCRVMSLRNRNLLPMLVATLGQRSARRRLIEDGQRLDVALRMEDGPIEHRELTAAEAERDWVEWPLPPIEPEEMGRLLDFEDDAALASFRGILVFRLKEKALWGAKTALAAAITLGPAILAASAAAGHAALGLGTFAWLGIFAAIEAIHLAEIPAALRAWKKEAERKALPWTRARAVRAVAGTLACGYPTWVPRKLGVYD